jgi:hypothetical protein
MAFCRFWDCLHVALATQAKLKLNAVNYPVDLVRGNSKKYDEL